MIQATQEKKKSFSSFTYRDAFKHLGITELQRWGLEAEPVPISDFFQQREVKSFVSPSEIKDLENALGQYVLYQSVLQKLEPERILHLAIAI